MGTQQKTKDYDEFVEKFKPKKTTDDCYTPKEVYDVVLQYVHGLIDFEDSQVVRPFCPGGDYAHFEYTEDCVVVDNPPFSIYSEIVRFYMARGIRFFLFGPNLTLFVKGADVTYVIASASVVYENGANVRTSFVTNLIPRERIVIAGSMKRCIEDAQKKAKTAKAVKKQNSYVWPKNFITPALMDKVANSWADFSIGKCDCVAITELDCGVEFFGTQAYLIKDEVAEAMKSKAAEAESVKAEFTRYRSGIVVELSERELAMIADMPQYVAGDVYIPNVPDEVKHDPIRRQLEMDFGAEFYTPRGVIEDILQSEKKGQEVEA